MQANEQRKVETPESPDDDFLPLTAEQAAQWRQRNPVVSVWQVVFWQAGVGIVLAALAGWWSGRWMVAASVLYGSAAVFVPAALLARGVTSRLTTASPMAAATGFLVWEGVKVAMTVMVLLLAPRLVEGLSWPALLLGLVVTMKVYWLALAWRPRPLKQDPWIKS